MVMNKIPMLVFAGLVGSGLGWAQDDDVEATPEIVEQPPSVTEHEIAVNGNALRFRGFRGRGAWHTFRDGGLQELGHGRGVRKGAWRGFVATSQDKCGNGQDDEVPVCHESLPLSGEEYTAKFAGWGARPVIPGSVNKNAKRFR